MELSGLARDFIDWSSSAVLILSDKARHFLLRTLCRLRKSERGRRFDIDESEHSGLPRCVGGFGQRLAVPKSGNCYLDHEEACRRASSR
jgi:hypothetical protein